MLTFNYFIKEIILIYQSEYVLQRFENETSI